MNSFEQSNVEIDARHYERNQLIASIQSALQKLDGEESEDEENVKGVSDKGVSDKGVSSTRRTEDGEPVNQADLRTIQAAGDEALRKLSENISIMEEKHAVFVGKLNVLAESLKRNRRSTLLHVQKPVTGITLDIDSLRKAERVDRYVNDLIQELVPAVGSTLRKSWDKYSTDADMCIYLQDGQSELPFTLIHYLLFLQYQLQQVWSKTGEGANVAAQIERYSYISAKDVLRDPPFGPWVERFYEMAHLGISGGRLDCP